LLHPFRKPEHGNRKHMRKVGQFVLFGLTNGL
jgi:hypothetical protein